MRRQEFNSIHQEFIDVDNRYFRSVKVCEPLQPANDFVQTLAGLLGRLAYGTNRLVQFRAIDGRFVLFLQGEEE